MKVGYVDICIFINLVGEQKDPGAIFACGFWKILKNGGQGVMPLRDICFLVVRLVALLWSLLAVL